MKICDPACGSGAFLNQAFDFLIKSMATWPYCVSTSLAESIAFSVENRILKA
ncbi:MAG: hypothetical protein IPM82_19000 [Saprospiraceae bacterium]|nr:hypothetical protein [Saprospiraceae bacterium]